MTDTTQEGAPSQALSFELKCTDGRARRGKVTVTHGSFETPAFMPVGTRGTVKGMTPRDLRETGAEICLGNTYHLNIAPGGKIVKKLGGLHGMMGWDAPILTDSGGFQVFSLPKLEIEEEGVTFAFKKGGKAIQLTPERSMQIQEALGADIIMAFDHVVAHPAPYHLAEEAVYRTSRWLERCRKAHTRTDQALFGIVQGSTFPNLRRLSVELICSQDLPGYAIGGLSVGEGHQLMMDTIDQTEPFMPAEKPRYLMGVGYPEDLVEAVARGVDMFDCVLPSRLARSGIIFTRHGRYRVTKGRYKADKFPLDTNCNCYACRNFSRAYVNHLINSKEILGSVLATLHNITFYQDLMRAMRQAIEEGRFESFRRAFLDEYLSDDRKEELDLEEVLGVSENEGDDLPWKTTHSVVPPTAVEENRRRSRRDAEVSAPEERMKEHKRASKGGARKGSKGNAKGQGKARRASSGRSQKPSKSSTSGKPGASKSGGKSGGPSSKSSKSSKFSKSSKSGSGKPK
ncbi:tRNA guanosine(34) transglycosylase Tgt [Lujinxingia vulgaris]|uniref:Queuine tRNA-ribosyltransferase n=1 Tax=Lujinxingia vulgaris TaxID=2600176 RepID=A0A5C6X6P5_9DELT|nr:tRNA guanosine(34) transglycosylase Tgt [Lujinxingia vulgaris]TXD36903.1 tRNA guanosine(34) transglycosylase Tgt [Lujinxingia vulgaris]